MTGKTDSVWIVAFLAIVITLAFVQRPAPEPGPQPGPASDIAAAADASFRLYADNLADVFATLATDLRGNRFASDAEFADAMEERTKAARLAAFTEFRGAFGAGQSGEWDAVADAKRCEEAAAGFRRAGK